MRGKKAQVQLMWVLIELVLVIAVAVAVWQMQERVKDDLTPEQSRVSLEVRLIKEAMESAAGANIRYRYGPNGLSSSSYPITAGHNLVRAGGVSTLAPDDLKLDDRSELISSGTVFFWSGSNRLIIEDPNNKQNFEWDPREVGCVDSEGSGRITVHVPEGSGERISSIGDILVSRSDDFVANDGRRSLVLQDGEDDRLLIRTNLEGRGMACRLLNGMILDTLSSEKGLKTAVVPAPKRDGLEKPLEIVSSSSSPAILVEVPDFMDEKEVSDAIISALS